MNTYPTLIRREFWEHRPLWIAPLVVSGCVILVTLIATVQIPAIDVTGAPKFGRGPLTFLTGGLAGVLAFELVIASIVVGFYLLDCLYAERKDRSILFWKSMPVSDRDTVLSKFILATVIMPLGVYVLAGLTSLLAAAIIYVRFDSLAGHLWDLSTWGRTYGIFLLGLFAGMLWYAPVIAYLLLISAWARRSVFLWAVLPPIVLLLLEAYAFDTHYVGAFLQYRLGAPPELIGAPVDPVSGAFGQVQLLEFLTLPGLWLGVAAAGALLFGAIRIRRFRDDT